MRIRALPVLSLLTLVSAAACGSSSNDASPNQAGGGAADASVSTPPTMVSAGGGTVTSADGNVTLVIPSGALASNVSVSIVPIPAPGGGAVGQVYDLEPTGTTFSLPVSLGFHGAALGTYPLTKETIATYSGSSWVGSTSTVQGAALVTSISHFSPWGVVLLANAVPPTGMPTETDDGGAADMDGGASENEGGTDGGSDGGPSYPVFATPNETAGSRLHPLYKRSTFSDGAGLVQRIAMYDATLGVPCDTGYLADGHFYCIPKTVSPGTGTGQNFADANCSVPLLMANATGPANACTDVSEVTNEYLDYGFYASDSVQLIHSVYATPATAKYTATTYWYKSGTTCSPEAFDPTTSNAYAVQAGGATLLDGSTLVAVNVSYAPTTAPATGRLVESALVQAGSDGSRWIADGHAMDTQINHFCAPAYTLDGTERCLPGNYGYEYYVNEHADSACGTTAYHYVVPTDVYSYGDPRASFAYVGAGGGIGDLCMTAGIDATAGETLVPSGTTLYEGSAGDCTVTPVYQEDAFATGPAPTAVDQTAFVPVSVTTTAATTNGASGSSVHISVTNTVGTDGSIAAGISAFAVDQFDPSTSFPCTPIVMSDGALHCGPPSPRGFRTPVDPTMATLFADAACTTQPVVSTSHSTEVCTRVPQSPWFTGGGVYVAGCASTNLYHATAPALTATTFYTKSGTACTATTVTSGTSSYYLISDIAAVTPAQLPTMTLSVEMK